MLAWHEPLFLLLIVLPVIFTVFVLRRARRYETIDRPRSTALALRCTCLAFLLAAAAQPVWRTSSAIAPPIAFVADVSASISPAARAAELAWLRAGYEQASQSESGSLITFAADSAVQPLSRTPGPDELSAAARNATTSSTNIEHALRLALGTLPGGGQIVLLSDGLQTAGDAQRAAEVAATDRVRINTVLLAGDARVDAAMTRFSLPERVHLGDQLPLQMTVHSSKASAARLSVAEDGHALGTQSVSLQSGDNPFLVNLNAAASGWHSFRATIIMGGDAVPQNNALDAVTDVGNRPRVLIVTVTPARSDVQRILGQEGLDIRAVTPKSFPTTLQALTSYDAVVLDNVPATALQSRQLAALARAVRDNGIGLLVSGGEDSFTLGHYNQSPLEPLLPVLSDTPNSLRQGNVALQLALDRSGSMNDLAGDSPKIVMAQRAADIAVDFAKQHADDLGIVSFDITAHILVPLQKIGSGNAGQVHATVDAMVADGGTNIHDALSTALAEVERSSAPYKHIILMTDGRSEQASYDSLLARMQQGQVTLSAIALGGDADTELLKYLAAKGKGRFYSTNNAADLPRIFAEEARISAGSPRVTGRLGVAINASSPLVRSLNAGALPTIKGYPATVLKATGIADLVIQARGHSADPVLAHWQYGIGRVAVWTPGAATAWAADWATKEVPVWNDVVRWLVRAVPRPLLAPALSSTNGVTRVTVDTRANAGEFVNLALLTLGVQTPDGAASSAGLDEVGPGLYTATLPTAGPGVYRIAVRSSDSSATTYLLAQPYAREYLPAVPNADLLARLADLSRGKVLTSPAQLDAPAVDPRRHERALWWGLAACALAVYVAVSVQHRLGRPP